MDYTARQLHDMPGIVAYIQLDLAVATRPSSTTSGKPGSKPPMPLGPVDDIDLAWSAVTTWARDWSEMWDYTPPAPYWASVCAYLERHWPRAEAEHPAADEFADEIRHHHGALRRHIGTAPRAWQPLPGRWTCPGIDDGPDPCGGKLLEHAAQRVIRCPRCGREWVGESEYERLGIMLGCELTVTVDQAALLAKVNRRTINRWIDSGALPIVATMTGERRIDKRDLTLIVVRREAT